MNEEGRMREGGISEGGERRREKEEVKGRGKKGEWG